MSFQTEKTERRIHRGKKKKDIGTMMFNFNGAFLFFKNNKGRMNDKYFGMV